MKQAMLSRTVRISNESYENVSKYGRFGESFDSVLKRVLNEKRVLGEPDTGK
jgi:predicted CopG family antitoxin